MQKIVDYFSFTKKYPWGLFSYNRTDTRIIELFIYVLDTKIMNGYVFYQVLNKKDEKILKREIKNCFADSETKIYKSPSVEYETQEEKLVTFKSLWDTKAFRDVCSFLHKDRVEHENLDDFLFCEGQYKNYLPVFGKEEDHEQFMGIARNS